MLVIVFLCCHLGIWDWEDCNSRHWHLLLLCWLCVLFSGLCWPFWFLEEYGGCVSGRECFWDPARCGHWGFQLDCFWVLVADSKEWGWIEWEEGLCVHRGKESYVCYQDLCRPCGMVVEMKERPQETFCKAWDNTEGLESEARRGSQYHLWILWTEWLICFHCVCGRWWLSNGVMLILKSY